MNVIMNVIIERADVCGLLIGVITNVNFIFVMRVIPLADTPHSFKSLRIHVMCENIACGKVWPIFIHLLADV
jgi:hypothetical protein